LDARARPGRVLIQKEGLIDENRHTRGERRDKTPAQGDLLRRLGRAAIVIAALVLIALAWVGAHNAIQTHRAEVRARVQAEVLGDTLTFQGLLRREFLSLDQTLRILQYEWRRGPENFDLATRSSQVVVLNDVSLQIFIADASGIVRASNRPAIIGTDINKRDYFQHEKSLPADDGKMFMGELTQGQVTRLWQINLARRLDNPDGSFGGIIAASYDANSFAQYYHEVVDPHSDRLIAVVSMRDATAWSLAGPDQVPQVESIAGTPFFAALRAVAEGNWTGAALDAVERIYAFATVPDQDLKVVAGVDRSKAMQEAADWELTALMFTSGITLLILVLALLLLRAQSAARRRHETLAREGAILEAALTGMTDGIMMVDRDLHLTAWNSHFPEFTGVPPEILRVGLPIEDIFRAQAVGGEFGPVEVEAEVARRLEMLRSGASMGMRERPRPGGRQLEVRRSRLPGGGFVTLYTDVTARRQTEERLRQAQTMAAVGRLTAGVAHDFNNLLAAITGNAEILHGQLSEQPTLAPRLAMILQTAGRGSDLVRRLLAFSRKQELAPVLVDLNKVVRGMGDLLRATLGRTIRVETELDEKLWLALIDPVQIEHVILNLAINARDAMPDGGTLTISTANTMLGPHSASADLPPGDYVIVAVTDTGTGMSEEVLQNVFEPFFTTKPPGQGSGLGLSQVYGMASQSGGGVRIDSALGKGTTVSVLFPRAADDAEGDGRPTQQHAVDPGSRDSLMAWQRCILVVDDEAECRDTIGAMLTADGFTVALAESGEAALRLVDSGLDFHLLLVDFNLPGMDGLELARQVRARRPSVPVVFITGADGEWVGGERWVLAKPFLSRTLIDTLRAALGLSGGPDAIRHSTSQTV
jgi:signal transduction histidine kinase/CheY-like chemotaxis protein